MNHPELGSDAHLCVATEIRDFLCLYIAKKTVLIQHTILPYAKKFGILCSRVLCPYPKVQDGIKYITLPIPENSGDYKVVYFVLPQKFRILCSRVLCPYPKVQDGIKYITLPIPENLGYYQVVYFALSQKFRIQYIRRSYPHVNVCNHLNPTPIELFSFLSKKL